MEADSPRYIFASERQVSSASAHHQRYCAKCQRKASHRPDDLDPCPQTTRARHLGRGHSHTKESPTGKAIPSGAITRTRQKQANQNRGKETREGLGSGGTSCKTVSGRGAGKAA